MENSLLRMDGGDGGDVVERVKNVSIASCGVQGKPSRRRSMPESGVLS